MANVILTGWKPGLNKVKLNYMLRRHAGLNLAAAKAVVDRLLRGEVVAVDCPDPSSALELHRAASSVGAICSLDAAVTSPDTASVT